MVEIGHIGRLELEYRINFITINLRNRNVCGLNCKVQIVENDIHLKE